MDVTTPLLGMGFFESRYSITSPSWTYALRLLLVDVGSSLNPVVWSKSSPARNSSMSSEGRARSTSTSMQINR